MIVDLASGALLIAGVLLLLLSIVAYVRFPDAASRIHAAGLASSIGFPVVVLGLIIRSEDIWAVFQYAAILLLGPLASATVAQALAWALRHRLEELRAARKGRR